jgi:hypothetical protein
VKSPFGGFFVAMVTTFGPDEQSDIRGGVPHVACAHAGWRISILHRHSGVDASHPPERRKWTLAMS